MKKKRLFKALAIALALLLLISDGMALPPAGRLERADAAMPGANVVVGFFRTFGAIRQRNRVYREAGATAAEINAYYDRLIAQAGTTRRDMHARAVAGDLSPRFVRSYVRIEAALERERQAAIQMVEAEKNQARRDFERALGREIARILIASPGGQRIISQVRETIQKAREAAVAVRAAADAGRPIEALSDALARQAGDIFVVRETVRELGSAAGHRLDRALGGLLTRIDAAIDDVQGEMGGAIDLLDQMDTTIARHDRQAREPVSLVEDSALLGAIRPVDRANPAIDVAASAFAGAAALSGNLEPGVSRATMHDRIRGALLDERIAAIREALAAGTAGQTYCTGVGRGPYEIAARQLGQTPQIAGDPGRAWYVVCYEIETQLPQYAKMFGGTALDTADVTPAVEEMNGPIPVGVYEGTTDLPLVLESARFYSAPGSNTTENRVIITVADDGTVTGSLSVHHASGAYIDDRTNCTTIWNYEFSGVFSGQFTANHGTIECMLDGICWASGSCQGDAECEIDPSIWQFDVRVSGNQMTGATPQHPEDEHGAFVWGFAATR